MKLLCIDTETTGVDVENDRVVTCFIGLLNEDNTWEWKHEWLLDPGVEIAEGASAVHGISTEHAREHGQDAAEGLYEIFQVLDDNWSKYPWVIMNANYDLSLLHHEFKRHSILENDFETLLTGPGAPEILDPRVIDLKKDKYRRGKRKLVNLAETYGVPFDEELAHDAAYDCFLTGQVTRKIISKYGKPNNRVQAVWYADWAKGFQEFKRRTEPDVVIDTGWPIKGQTS